MDPMQAISNILGNMGEYNQHCLTQCKLSWLFPCLRPDSVHATQSACQDSLGEKPSCLGLIQSDPSEKWEKSLVEGSLSSQST